MKRNIGLKNTALKRGFPSPQTVNIVPLFTSCFPKQHSVSLGRATTADLHIVPRCAEGCRLLPDTLAYLQRSLTGTPGIDPASSILHFLVLSISTPPLPLPLPLAPHILPAVFQRSFESDQSPNARINNSEHVLEAH